MARKSSLEKMREVLMVRREALKKALDGDLSLLTELREQTSGDVVDFALDSAQDEISSQLAEVESRELSNIERALGKMNDGTYGQCEACEKDIPMARLQALPYAVLCINCQREVEKSGIDPDQVTDWSRVLDLGGDSDPVIGDLELDVS